MNPAFWRGKRVFVTGHTGFKGSWLSLWLQRHGAEVTGYSLEPPTNPSLFEAADVARGMRSIHGDVRDLAALSAALRDSRAEIVLHMAAQPLVRASYATPVETFDTNVMGTVNLLEAVRNGSGVRSVVVVTSDKCYENREWPWAYRENDAFGGADPYSASKGAAEIVTASYRRSFFPPDRGIGVASARAGNVIGGGDWAADRLIPDIIRAFLAGEPLRLRHPNATRPWQHVLEPLSGYLLLVEKMWDAPADFADGWNFGPSDAETLTTRAIADRLARAWGGSARWELAEGAQLHEAASLRLDSSKARQHLGWTPRFTLDETLRGIVDWYRGHAEGADARALVDATIDAYESGRS